MANDQVMCWVRSTNTSSVSSPAQKARRAVSSIRLPTSLKRWLLYWHRIRVASTTPAVVLAECSFRARSSSRHTGGKRDDASIYGQESNPTTWRLAAMNLAIQGFNANLGQEPADTFARDQFPDQKFDYILANPPFNISDWGGEKYESDPRWVYGRPPVGNANYAWLQHMLWKLRPGAEAGVVLANCLATIR